MTELEATIIEKLKTITMLIFNNEKNLNILVGPIKLVSCLSYNVWPGISIPAYSELQLVNNWMKIKYDGNEYSFHEKIINAEIKSTPDRVIDRLRPGVDFNRLSISLDEIIIEIV